MDVPVRTLMAFGGHCVSPSRGGRNSSLLLRHLQLELAETEIVVADPLMQLGV
jgi:hypothetical protein